MSDSARLARQLYLSKPDGLSYSSFKPNASDIVAIDATLNDAVLESAYAAVVSYAEAMSSLKHGSISWSIVRLYYSCFYSIRALLLLRKVVPFNCNGEMLLDISDVNFHKGGKSSHHWNWNSIEKTKKLTNSWIISADSQESYQKLREHRENVNYTHGFTDPNFHCCLISGEADLVKRFKLYKDDDAFFYTYLPEHLAIAYPTKLIFELDMSVRNLSICLESEKISHIKKIWGMKDRCPMS